MEHVVGVHVIAVDPEPRLPFIVRLDLPLFGFVEVQGISATRAAVATDVRHRVTEHGIVGRHGAHETVTCLQAIRLAHQPVEVVVEHHVVGVIVKLEGHGPHRFRQEAHAGEVGRQLHCADRPNLRWYPIPYRSESANARCPYGFPATLDARVQVTEHIVIPSWSDCPGCNRPSSQGDCTTSIPPRLGRT